ncbi:uncharacterized protein LOC130727664 [Lotus japonicus]|uniref:uncharacterized protein LOC130727664 n=1 Tax=Lotus japonicus TaxID=34305 RepID=UPI00258A04F3|nr:uncharacterized protein LOC130727664 [Lotus japonicus]
MPTATALTLALRHVNRRLPMPSLRGVRVYSSVGANPTHASSFCFTRGRLFPSSTGAIYFNSFDFAPPPNHEPQPQDERLNLDRYRNSETKVRDLFESWCRKYHKTYSSEEQKLFRFNAFKKTLEGATYENQLTIYADITSEEWEEMNLLSPSYSPDSDRLRSSEVENRNPNPDGSYFHSETEARELFEIWCKQYHKTYNSEEEKLYRFGVFKKTHELCVRENQKHADPLYRSLGTNGFGDLTMDEKMEVFGAGPWKPLEHY